MHATLRRIERNHEGRNLTHGRGELEVRVRTLLCTSATLIETFSDSLN